MTCKYIHILRLNCLIFVGNSTLREIFMKTDNYIRGKFFAFLIKVSTYFYLLYYKCIVYLYELLCHTYHRKWCQTWRKASIRMLSWGFPYTEGQWMNGISWPSGQLIMICIVRMWDGWYKYHGSSELTCGRIVPKCVYTYLRTYMNCFISHNKSKSASGNVTAPLLTNVLAHVSQALCYHFSHFCLTNWSLKKCLQSYDKNSLPTYSASYCMHSALYIFISVSFASFACFKCINTFV